MTSIIITAIVVFFVVTIVLVAVLLYAKSKLTSSGEVKININDDKELMVESGNTLLSTLGDNGIFLPSACGGGGACGMCRVQVLDGGGDILPTEVNFFTRRQQQEHWRLACQVKVKQDLKIQVPESVLGVKKWPIQMFRLR